MFNPETRAWEAGDTAPGPDRDRGNAEQLYNLLEREVLPMYYTLSENGIPHMWVKKMKETIRSTALRFSARRMVKEVNRCFMWVRQVTEILFVMFSRLRASTRHGGARCFNICCH